MLEKLQNIKDIKKQINEKQTQVRKKVQVEIQNKNKEEEKKTKKAIGEMKERKKVKVENKLQQWLFRITMISYQQIKKKRKK